MRPTTLIWHEIIPQFSAPTVCFIGLSRWMDGTVATQLREHHKSAGDSIKRIKAATETENLERQDAVLHIKAPPVLMSCVVGSYWCPSCLVWHYPKGQKSELLRLSPPVCVCCLLWSFEDVYIYAHPPIPGAHLESAARFLRHSAMWPPGGVVVWKFSADGISFMSFYIPGCCFSRRLSPWSPALGVTKGQRNAKDLKIIG